METTDIADGFVLLTVEKTVEKGPLTDGQLRWHLFHRKSNGLSKAVFKVGKRLLIDYPEYLQWLRSNQGDR